VEAAAPPVSRVAPSESKAARTPRNSKAKASAHLSATSASAAQPSAVAPVTNAATTEESKPDASAAESSASPENSSVFAAPYAGVVSDAGKAPSGSQGCFLEVGSFKDPTWADQAVAKLTQLGFQSFSLHKSKLWLQSYQVRVGPYADQASLEEARKNLVLQGFKPHPVK